MSCHVIAMIPRVIKLALAQDGIIEDQYCKKCGFFDENVSTCKGKHTIILYSPLTDFVKGDKPLHCAHCGINYSKFPDCVWGVPNELSLELTGSTSTHVEVDTCDQKSTAHGNPQFSQASQEETRQLVSAKYKFGEFLSGSGLIGTSKHESEPSKKYGVPDQKNKLAIGNRKLDSDTYKKKPSPMASIQSGNREASAMRNHSDSHSSSSNIGSTDQAQSNTSSYSPNPSIFSVQDKKPILKNLLFLPIQMVFKPRPNPKSNGIFEWLRDNSFFVQSVLMTWPLVSDIRLAYPIVKERHDIQFELGNAVKRDGSDAYLETYSSYVKGETLLWNSENLSKLLVGTMSEMKTKRMKNIDTLVVRVR